jgi:uncharacterized protein YjdB
MFSRRKALIPFAIAALLHAGCRITPTISDGIAVTGVALDRSAAEITGSATLQLNAAISPANASNKAVSWTSSDPAVADVTASGLVTGYAVGSATIAVHTADGDKTASCAVSVTSVPVSGVTLPGSASIVGNQTVSLVPVISPENALNKAVTWTTSDLTVATVSSVGVVSGLNSGSATITVHTADGDKTASCAVTVTRVTVTGVALPEIARLTSGFTAQLAATVSPANATDQRLGWSSDNASIATVSDSGLVTGVGVGSTTIRVTAAGGAFSDACALTVAAPGTITIIGN